jgi:4'-phosphopantetheinyl transferase
MEMTLRPPSWNSWWDHPLLRSDDVHVWRVALDQPASVAQSFLRILAPDERRRSENYYFPKDRDCFVIARGVLRTLLGRYLQSEPDQLRFCYGSHGKPALIGPSGSDQIRFSVSHSNQLALCAVTRNREVGVDVEYVREDLANTEIAERFFSSREAAMLRALPIERRVEGFFNCWTRKEAYVKARGRGLSLPLNLFDVSVGPGAGAAILSTQENSKEALNWSLRDLEPAHGYVAALAVAGGNWRLSCWDWAG